MRRKLIPLLLFFIVLPIGGLVYSVHVIKTQSEYQIPTKQAAQQAQRKQAAQQAQRKQAAQREQRKQAAQQAQSKQSAQQGQKKQTAQQGQKKQPVQQVQSAPQRHESLQLPAYSEFSTRKRPVQPIQNVSKTPEAHQFSAYSVYSTSKHNVHQVQGGYMQTATSDVPSHSMRGQRIMTTGALYASTVYVPFDSKTPSAYSEDLAMADRGVRRAKQDFIQRPDDDPAQTSPVGEPWVLLAFALLFGGVIAIRKKNKGKVGSTSEV